MTEINEIGMPTPVEAIWAKIDGVTQNVNIEEWAAYQRATRPYFWEGMLWYWGSMDNIPTPTDRPGTSTKPKYRYFNRVGRKAIYGYDPELVFPS